VRETRLARECLIMPYFICAGENRKEAISSMPGQFRFTGDQILFELDRLVASGLSSVILFGIPDRKDEKASEAYAKAGVIQTAIREIKRRFPKLLVIADTCLCEYMSHGHCGLVRRTKDGPDVANDETLELLARTAVSQADAGADMVAPSDMMDGRVQAIRAALDEAGFQHVPILSYAAKFASVFYGPFREAAFSVPEFGDRKTYQMDPANREEALREIAADIEEGADLVMVKPALAYLDVIREAKDAFSYPVVAYNVSGEYAFVKWAGREGWDEKALTLEILTAIKRAGADLIITYHAVEASPWLA
jgi:porphobilinogen synthase